MKSQLDLNSFIFSDVVITNHHFAESLACNEIYSSDHPLETWNCTITVENRCQNNLSQIFSKLLFQRRILVSKRKKSVGFFSIFFMFKESRNSGLDLDFCSVIFRRALSSALRWPAPVQLHYRARSTRDRCTSSATPSAAPIWPSGI